MTAPIFLTPLGTPADSPNLTVNGVTVTPMFSYKANDAGTTWNSWNGYGLQLSQEFAGTIATGQAGPLNSPLNKSVLFDGSKVYYEPTAVTGTIGLEDFAIHIVFQSCDAGGYLGGRWNSGTSGWGIFMTPLAWYGGVSGIAFFAMDAGLNESYEYSGIDIASSSWYDFWIFCNRSVNSATGTKFYLNGHDSITGSTNLYALHAATLDGPGQHLTVGGLDLDVGTTWKYPGKIALFEGWKCQDWFKEGAAGPTEWQGIVTARYNALAGVAGVTGSKLVYWKSPF
jgi:hypothetical protein